MVVLLVHEGAATDRHRVRDRSRRRSSARSSPASAPNVDAIVSGHTHLAVQPRDRRPTRVISSGQYGERFSRMDIQYDQTTETVTMKNEIFNLMDGTVAAVPGRPGGRGDRRRRRGGGQQAGQRRARQATADFGRPFTAESAGPHRRREPRRRVDARQLRRRRAARPRTRTAARRADRLHEPGRPARRPRTPDGTVTYREASTCSRSRTRGDPDAHGRADQAGARGAVAAGRGVASVAEARRQQGAHLHLRPTAAAGSHIAEIAAQRGHARPGRHYRVDANSFLAAGGDNFVTLGKGTSKADTATTTSRLVNYFAVSSEHDDRS